MTRLSVQRGLSLMELAFAMVIFAFVITAVIYGLRVVKQSKVKAFIVQVTQIQDAAETFKRRYGTWPGDFAQAAGPTGRLKNCDATTNCQSGNGDEIIASSNSANCRLPAYADPDQPFPCTTVDGGNETAQFWRHLVLSGMLTGIKISSGNTYKWGDGLPKVRMGGGLQVIYNGDPANLYVADYGSGALTGHFLSYQRVPGLLHRSFFAAGDGPIASYDTQAIDTILDDGLPLAGKMRSTGDWGCGNVANPIPANRVYTALEQMQCFILFKFED